MIKYHSNHFGVGYLAHNKKKAIQGLSEQVIHSAGNMRILKVYQQRLYTKKNPQSALTYQGS
ncbi:hypothetical protein [Nostoc sp. NMS4]|uniref:hypothetical protein n=1 Tax=Nostoc sp. NMS4 TaxID=2815390 RepID=UPI0025DDE4E5|nr:hypothetical protein [Nostoc sp. NMS4]MBN3925158.1 hypothetical protein [Nostoc sp. NMS4]